MSNKDWAFAEAARRAEAMQKGYGIFQHKRNIGDHIIRPVDVAAPQPFDWNHVTTIYPKLAPRRAVAYRTGWDII